MSVVAGYEQSDAAARADGLEGLFDEENFVGIDEVTRFMSIQTGRSEAGAPFVSVLMDDFGLDCMVLQRYPDRDTAVWNHDVWVRTLRTNTSDIQLTDIDDPGYTFTWDASEAS